MSDSDEFVIEFTRLRKSLNLTQTDIAQLLDVSQKSVSNFENGLFAPRPELMKRYRHLYEAMQRGPKPPEPEPIAPESHSIPSLRSNRPEPPAGLELPYFMRRSVRRTSTAWKDSERPSYSDRSESRDNPAQGLRENDFEIEAMQRKLARFENAKQTRKPESFNDSREVFNSQLLRVLQDEVRQLRMSVTDAQRENLELRRELQGLRHVLVDRKTTFDSDEPADRPPLSSLDRHHLINSEFQPPIVPLNQWSPAFYPATPHLAGPPRIPPGAILWLDDDSTSLRSSSRSRPQAERVESTIAAELDRRLGSVLPAGKWIARHGASVSEFSFVPETMGLVHVPNSRISSVAESIRVESAQGTPRICPSDREGIVRLEFYRESRDEVRLCELLRSPGFAKLKAELPIALGCGIGIGEDDVVILDLASLPHLLIAGEPGSGVNAVVSTIVASLLSTRSPDDLRLLALSPGNVELWSAIAGIPHLANPLIRDVPECAAALQWLITEMERRYRLLQDVGLRDSAQYNRNLADGVLGHQLRRNAPAGLGQENLMAMPYLVCIVDELFRMMIHARSSVEDDIVRLAQMGRGVGIHLVIATEYPVLDVLSGVVTANFIARVALRVSDTITSRRVLATVGAEKLMGSGDMLYQSPEHDRPIRVQAATPSFRELSRLKDYWMEGVSARMTAQAPERSSVAEKNPFFELIAQQFSGRGEKER